MDRHRKTVTGSLNAWELPSPASMETVFQQAYFAPAPANHLFPAPQPPTQRVPHGSENRLVPLSLPFANRTKTIEFDVVGSQPAAGPWEFDERRMQEGPEK